MGGFNLRSIMEIPLLDDQVGLWFLGQSGYILRAGDLRLTIDPYLSDSVGRVAPEFSRLYAPPLDPADLQVDIYVVTHDHLDHLDPETICTYRHVKTTTFVAPRLACNKLADLGIPLENIVRVDAGESVNIRGVQITGIYALPTELDALDTCGYHIQFANGKSIYHTSDTDFSELLLLAAPKVDVMLTCINGKDGNLDPQQAARLAKTVAPRVAAIPNHYDMMALNAENPQTFVYFAHLICPDIPVKILETLKPFVW